MKQTKEVPGITEDNCVILKIPYEMFSDITQEAVLRAKQEKTKKVLNVLIRELSKDFPDVNWENWVADVEEEFLKE